MKKIFVFPFFVLAAFVSNEQLWLPDKFLMSREKNRTSRSKIVLFRISEDNLSFERTFDVDGDDDNNDISSSNDEEIYKTCNPIEGGF